MGPFGELPDVDGVDHAVDQTQRRKAFEAAHPEWRIWIEGWTWRAERVLPDGVRESVSSDAIRFLLDNLEKR